MEKNKDFNENYFKSKDFEEKIVILEKKDEKNSEALKEKPNLLWQSNFISSARYDMTVLEKNIIYIVTSLIKKNDPIGKIYKLSTVEIMYLTKTDINYAAFKIATAKLIGRVIEGLDSDGNWLQTSFVASAVYKTGEGIIEIELSQKIHPQYINLKEKFTTYEFNIALSLKSVYSKRIYEMLSQYKNMKDKSFKIGFKELKDRFYLIDRETKKDKYPKFTHFKIAVLDVAEKEINGNTDIFFTYKTIEGKRLGKGRKPVSEIEFSIVYQSPEEKEKKEYYAPLFERLTTTFKLRKDQATLILEKYSKEEINKELYQISLKMTSKEIRDVGAFTAKVFSVHEAK